MELFEIESTSVVATDKASNISSWTSIEGGLEGFREEEALCSLDVRCDVCALSEIKCTRCRTSKHSASSYSAEINEILELWGRISYTPKGSRLSLRVPENNVAS